MSELNHRTKELSNDLLDHCISSARAGPEEVPGVLVRIWHLNNLEAPRTRIPRANLHLEQASPPKKLTGESNQIMSTTPTPHISKNMSPKYAMKRGIVWRKILCPSAKSRDFHRFFMEYETDFYGIRTPTFFAIRTDLILGMGGGLRYVEPETFSLFPSLTFWNEHTLHRVDCRSFWTDALRTLTSLNKEVWRFFLGDNSIWCFPSVSSLGDSSIWRS